MKGDPQGAKTQAAEYLRPWKKIYPLNVAMIKRARQLQLLSNPPPV